MARHEIPQVESETTDETSLEILLKNTNPDLACEIEECWIEQDTITIGKLLGKGTELHVCMCVCLSVCLSVCMYVCF